jgi:hypothetical protein
LEDAAAMRDAWAKIAGLEKDEAGKADNQIGAPLMRRVG